MSNLVDVLENEFNMSIVQETAVGNFVKAKQYLLLLLKKNYTWCSNMIIIIFFLIQH